MARGALPLPGGAPLEDVRDLFVPAQTTLLDMPAEASAPEPQPEAMSSEDYSVLTLEQPASNGAVPADIFFSIVWNALADYLTEPRRPEDVAKMFGVPLPQVRAWLGRAVDEGKAEKKTRPVRYVTVGR